MLVPRRPKQVPLHNQVGIVIAHALVDSADYQRVIAMGAWCLGGQPAYVIHKHRYQPGQQVTISLHRFVLDLTPNDPQVDHRDRNPLNNQKYNLRVCTHAQNMQNKNKYQTSNPYRGVTWCAAAGRWRARTRLNTIEHYLGLFNTPEEANAVVVAWRAEHMPFSEEYADAHS